MSDFHARNSLSTHGVHVMSYHILSVVDGSSISVRQLVPPAEAVTKAVFQLTHGISEHSGRYDRFARFLAKNGYRVYASDLRGHGLSVPQSELGKASLHFWQDTTADMKQLLDLMQSENSKLPCFAFGHRPWVRVHTIAYPKLGRRAERGYIMRHVWRLSRNERRAVARSCACTQAVGVRGRDF
jgi:predicted alpha/beta hydrolase